MEGSRTDRIIERRYQTIIYRNNHMITRKQVMLTQNRLKMARKINGVISMQELSKKTYFSINDLTQI